MKVNFKKNSFHHLHLFVLFIILASLTLAYGSNKTDKAQSNKYFRKIVKEMEEAYENGNLNLVIRLYMERCLEDEKKQIKPGKEKKEFIKTSKEIRVDIYQLVALSYYALDKPEKGDLYLRKLLLLKRREGTDKYWLSIKNRARDKFVVAPRLLLGVKSAINITTAHPVTRYSVLEPAFSEKEEQYSYDKEYFFDLRSVGSTFASFNLEYCITKRFSVIIEFYNTIMRFQYKNSLYWEIEGEDPVTVEFKHRQKLYYWEMPLLLKYRFRESKLKPFLQLGLYISFFDIINKPKNTVKLLVNEEFKEEAIIGLSELFKKINGGGCVGAGVEFDTGIKGVIMGFEINYKRGFTNIVDGAHRYNYKYRNLTFGYYDVFDDINLSNLDFTLRILVPLSYKTFRR